MFGSSPSSTGPLHKTPPNADDADDPTQYWLLGSSFPAVDVLLSRIFPPGYGGPSLGVLRPVGGHLVIREAEAMAETGDLQTLGTKRSRTASTRLAQTRCAYALTECEGIITGKLNVQVLDSDYARPVLAGAQAAVEEKARPKRTTFGLQGDDFVRSLFPLVDPSCGPEILRVGLEARSGPLGIPGHQVVVQLKWEAHRLCQSDGHAHINPGALSTAHAPFVQCQHEKRLHPRQIRYTETGGVSAGQSAAQRPCVELGGDKRV